MNNWDYPYYECEHGIRSGTNFVHHAPGGHTGISAVTAPFPPCHPKYVTEAA